MGSKHCAVFSYIAWAIYVTGLVVSCFEIEIEYQYVWGNLKNTGINVIKGVMALNLFTVAPIELYKLSVNLQATILAAGLMVLKGYELLGLGLMISAGEVPRRTGSFCSKQVKRFLFHVLYFKR